MIINYECKASKQSKEVLGALNKAVTNALDKKQKLGQYAVVWDRKQNSPKILKANELITNVEEAIFAYKVVSYYEPEHDRDIAYNDLKLNKNWQLGESKLQLSDKDKNQPKFSALTSSFGYDVNYYA